MWPVGMGESLPQQNPRLKPSRNSRQAACFRAMPRSRAVCCGVTVSCALPRLEYRFCGKWFDGRSAGTSARLSVAASRHSRPQQSRSSDSSRKSRPGKASSSSTLEAPPPLHFAERSPRETRTPSARAACRHRWLLTARHICSRASCHTRGRGSEDGRHGHCRSDRPYRRAPD